MYPTEVYRSYLTPLRFIQRSAAIFREKPAVVYGDRSWTYPQFAERIYRLASALREAGVKGEVEFLNVFMSQQDWGECRNTGALRSATASM